MDLLQHKYGVLIIDRVNMHKQCTKAPVPTWPELLIPTGSSVSKPSSWLWKMAEVNHFLIHRNCSATVPQQKMTSRSLIFSLFDCFTVLCEKKTTVLQCLTIKETNS